MALAIITEIGLNIWCMAGVLLSTHDPGTGRMQGNYVSWRRAGVCRSIRLHFFL